MALSDPAAPANTILGLGVGLLFAYAVHHLRSHPEADRNRWDEFVCGAAAVMCFAGVFVSLFL